ncbi:iron-sulfur cluster co-chaperone protein HscB isoform X1 [Capsicum chacoense]
MWMRKLRILTPFSQKLLFTKRETITISSSYCKPEFDFHTVEQFFPQYIRRVNFRGNNLGFCGRSLFSCEAAQRNSCWNCCNAKAFLVCTDCGCVQPVDHSVDYFKIFGLEKKYGIEGENLERTYKDWQRKLHPDLVHTKSQKEREYAAEQSARVIDAYRTLTDPLSRAIYILKLEDVHVDEEEKIDDVELLTEMLEIRETVDEAADSQALKQIQEQCGVWPSGQIPIQGKFEQSSISFADALQSRKYIEALAAIRRMTYYKRANEEIVKKL